MSDYDDAVNYMRGASISLGRIERERVRLAARVAELEGQVTEPDPPVIVDPPDPPIIVDPPPPPPTVSGDPDFSSLACAPHMPRWTHYDTPTEGDCDWTVQDRIGTSRKGLGLIHADGDGGIIGHCYRASIDAGHGPRVTIGVRGWGGGAMVGGHYWHGGGGDVACLRPDGSWTPIDIQLVSLDPTAAVKLWWGGFPSGNEWGRTERLAVFGLNIKNPANTHAIVATRECGDIILDGVAFEQPTEGLHNTALHIANWRKLVVRNLRRKAKFQQHALYLKSSCQPGSETWVVGSDLRGGNRSCVQRRPGRDEPYLSTPRDTVVIADCMLDGYGWDHANEDGGAAISLWAGDKAFVVRNSALDVRYGALNVSGQPLYTGSEGSTLRVNFNRNWYNANGFPVGEVHVEGNRFSNPRSQRHCVSVSNTERLVWGHNRVAGSMCLDTEWSSTREGCGPRNGSVEWLGPRPDRLMTYDAALGREVLMAAGPTPL